MSKTKWSSEVRQALKEKKSLREEKQNPFREDGYNSYRDLCNTPDPTPGDAFIGRYGTAIAKLR